MGDVSGLLGLLQSPGPPLYLVALILFVMAFRASPLLWARLLEGRRDRAKIEGEQYERLAAWCQRLQDSEEQCHRDLSDAIRRIAELEGYNAGKGKARQDAAGIVALDRLTDRKKPNA